MPSLTVGVWFNIHICIPSEKGLDHINQCKPATCVCLSQIQDLDFQRHVSFAFNDLKSEVVIFYNIDIGGTFYHRCLNIIFINWAFLNNAID